MSHFNWKDEVELAKANINSGLGIKKDFDKPRMDLIPTRPLLDIGQVMSFGATKYAERNWEKGLAWGRVYASALRHLFAWWAGEDRDPETGLSHLAHAACCVLFLMEYEYTKQEFDDRPKR